MRRKIMVCFRPIAAARYQVVHAIGSASKRRRLYYVNQGYGNTGWVCWHHTKGGAQRCIRHRERTGRPAGICWRTRAKKRREQWRLLAIDEWARGRR